MNHGIRSADKYTGSVRAPRAIGGRTKLRGRWAIVCRRDGQELWRDEWENIIVTEGLNHALEVTLDAATQQTTWYVGLLDASPSIVATDTMGSISEFATYTGNRKTWTGGSVAAGSIDNVGNEAVFTISADTQTAGGAFITPNATGTTGVLYAAGAFSGGNKAVDSDDTLTVTATFTAIDDA